MEVAHSFSENDVVSKQAGMDAGSYSQPMLAGIQLGLIDSAIGGFAKRLVPGSDGALYIVNVGSVENGLGGLLKLVPEGVVEPRGANLQIEGGNLVCRQGRPVRLTASMDQVASRSLEWRRNGRLLDATDEAGRSEVIASAPGVYQAIVREDGLSVGKKEVRIAHNSIRVADGVVRLVVEGPSDVDYIVESMHSLDGLRESHGMLLESVDADGIARLIFLDANFHPSRFYVVKMRSKAGSE